MTREKAEREALDGLVQLPGRLRQMSHAGSWPECQSRRCGHLDTVSGAHSSC